MNDKDHVVEILIDENKIQKIVFDLAKLIYRDFGNQEIVLVGVLDGSYAIVADLARALSTLGMNKIIVDFMGIDTYGTGTTSSKDPRITKDLKHDIRDKVVLIVEDIVDTGYSLSVLQALLLARLPKKLATVALLSKDERREIQVPVEYIGQHIPNVFVVGYGLDYDGKYYRELPYVGVVKFN
jgi:hypoxanthine phosphoribosyltransferase